jgi:hypothetical protein
MYPEEWLLRSMWGIYRYHRQQEGKTVMEAYELTLKKHVDGKSE